MAGPDPISEEEVEAIFAEIASFTIELSDDPSTLGPIYFMKVIAECRKYTNRVSFHLNDMAKRKASVMKPLMAMETLFRSKSDHLLASDPTVKGLKNIVDRQATVNVILSTERTQIDSLKAQVATLETVEAALKHTHRELSNLSSEIKNQQKIVEIELKTKAFYGDESQPAPAKRSVGPMGNRDFSLPSGMSSKETDEIDAFLAEEGIGADKLSHWNFLLSV